MSLREEQNGKFFMGNGLTKDLIMSENPIIKEARLAREQKEMENNIAKLKELDLQKQKELEDRLENLELIPNGNKIILLPYPTNPYKKLMQGSLYVGYEGEFLNPDSGEKDKLEVFVGCAKVIEVGPDCKLAKCGDDVFYDTRTTYPVPFLSLGYILTSEPQILTFMNNSLKKRFKMED